MLNQLRTLSYGLVVVAAATLAACGGGGGGGTVPSTQPTTSATATPTAAPTNQATTAPVSANTTTTVQLGGISNGSSNEVSSASLTLPAAGTATTVSVSMAAAAPSGVTAPALRSMAKRSAALGIESTVAYLTLQFANDVTIAQPPAFSITLPGAPSGDWYVLFDDPSGALTSGWSEVAELTISGDTLSYTPSGNLPQAMTLKANQKYYFAISTTGNTPIVSPSPVTSPTASPTASPSSSPSASPSSSPTASPTPEATIDPSAIPMGMTTISQGKWSTTTPQAGYIYSCQSNFSGGGASTIGPWVNQTNLTWSENTKVAVQGSNSWTSTYSAGAQSGSTFTITTNDEPLNETTGTYPIAMSDPAHQYDQNPNSITAQSFQWVLQWAPAVASTPSCLPMGAIGVMNDGVVLYNGLDALGRDAAAFETLDSCEGHPDSSGEYHYHQINVNTGCFPDTKDTDGHSGLLGYAFDGFGIYGPDGVGGNQLKDSDLDECHGHTHMVLFHGVEQNIYHYHVTTEYPYTLGCYKGTPIHGY